MKIQPVAKYDWEHKYYYGRLIAVSNSFLAYAIRGEIPAVLYYLFVISAINDTNSTWDCINQLLLQIDSYCTLYVIFVIQFFILGIGNSTSKAGCTVSEYIISNAIKMLILYSL